MLEGFIRNNKKAIYLLAFYFLLILLISFYWPKQIDWRPSYSSLHSKPYGTKVLHNELQFLFPEAQIETSPRPIYNTVHDSLEILSGSTYMFINSSFSPDSLELSRLYAFAEEGNTIFIAAESITGDLLDTLHVLFTEDYLYGSELEVKDFAFQQTPFSTRSYNFQKLSFLRYFEADSLFQGSSISYIDTEEKMNQVIVPFGDGRFILNSFPLAFTNYNILNDETRDYSTNCLSYLGDTNSLIWDEYYKVGKPGSSKTPLVEILKIPGLRWAYWLSLATILLFVGFHSKRRQRIIPIEEEVKNNSVEYVETMGNLYFEQANYRSIALKKIEYFKSYLYRNYNLANVEYSETDVMRLLPKTDKTKEEINELFALINRIQSESQVNVETLKVLTEKVNNFYK